MQGRLLRVAEKSLYITMEGLTGRVGLCLLDWHHYLVMAKLDFKNKTDESESKESVDPPVSSLISTQSGHYYFISTYYQYIASSSCH